MNWVRILRLFLVTSFVIPPKDSTVVSVGHSSKGPSSPLSCLE